MTILIYILSLSIALFQVIDYWTTTQIINRGGVEVNKVERYLILKFGVEFALLATKGFAAVFVIVGAIQGWWESQLGLIALGALFLLYAWVVIHNWMEYKKTR